MEKKYNAAHAIQDKQSKAVSAFALMNEQYINNPTCNSIKPYLTSVAHQQIYTTASIRAQLTLGIMYAQKTAASQSKVTQQFYALKAKEYLGAVALQEQYRSGQECALAILQLLTMQ
ncbi:MAG: hypothetical protein WD055_02790 [Candidatus Dependentiae bacterium]